MHRIHSKQHFVGSFLKLNTLKHRSESDPVSWYWIDARSLSSVAAVAQTAAACAGNIIHNYMASINRINQELESLTREEAIELIRRLRRELSTNANVSNEGDASQQPNQILQQLLAQPTNQRDLLRRAIELLPTLHTTAAIVNVFSIILFLWTTFQFLHKSFS